MSQQQLGEYSSCRHKWVSMWRVPHPEKDNTYIEQVKCYYCNEVTQREVPAKVCPNCGEE